MEPDHVPGRKVRSRRSWFRLSTRPPSTVGLPPNLPLPIPPICPRSILRNSVPIFDFSALLSVHGSGGVMRFFHSCKPHVPWDRCSARLRNAFQRRALPALISSGQTSPLPLHSHLSSRRKELCQN